MFKSLSRAVVGAVVDVPLSVVADVVTLGGVCTGRDTPYTAKAVARVVKNVEDSVEPDREKGT